MPAAPEWLTPIFVTLRDVFIGSSNQELQPTTWWDRVWPAWFGSTLMIITQSMIFLLSNKDYLKSFLDLMADPRGASAMATSLLLLGFLLGSLFATNHALPRLRRFLAGAFLPILVLIIAFSWKRWLS